jgi:hypothetical protein
MIQVERKAAPKEGANSFPSEDQFSVFCNNRFSLKILGLVLQSNFYPHNSINDSLQQNPSREWI